MEMAWGLPAGASSKAVEIQLKSNKPGYAACTGANPSRSPVRPASPNHAAPTCLVRPAQSRRVVSNNLARFAGLHWRGQRMGATWRATQARWKKWRSGHDRAPGDQADVFIARDPISQ